jgi:hypothetical protein
MHTPVFSVVRRTPTAFEADMLIEALRSNGFHPLDLATASHFSLAGADIAFHIEVPTNELVAARKFFEQLDNGRNRK